MTLPSKEDLPLLVFLLLGFCFHHLHVYVSHHSVRPPVCSFLSLVGSQEPKTVVAVCLRNRGQKPLCNINETALITDYIYSPSLSHVFPLVCTYVCVCVDV